MGSGAAEIGKAGNAAERRGGVAANK